MVAKISIGSSLHGALTYNGEKVNEAKGHILAANKIILPSSGKVKVRDMADNFRAFMPKMGRTKKPVLHISLNPHPDDGLSDQEMEKLAREYLEKLGFGEQPWVMYLHEDTDRHHIHIVTVNVNEKGKRLDQTFLFRRSKKITNELEDKYNLHKARREKISRETPITKLDPSGDLKRQIANIVKLVGMRWRFQTIGEYNAILGLYNVRCEQTDGKINGREYHGLVYFALNENGEPMANPFKASRLGKFAGREAIAGLFDRNRERIKIEEIRRKVSDAKKSSKGIDDFVGKLHEKNIDLVLRYTDNGRIYGATFIDHESATAVNGSRLGKDYSANAIDQWNNATIPNSDKRTITDSDAMDEKTAIGEIIAIPHRKTNDNADLLDGSYSVPYIPDLGGLFQTGPSFDAEEEAFYRAMQRKKKKRRGPKL